MPKTLSYIGIAPRVRKSPFYNATLRYGAKAFTVYNHMLMPLYYESPEADYRHLVNAVALWDVAVERQVELTGPDAYALVRLLTPRNLETFPVGMCKYAPIVDEHGGMINDPLILRLGEQHFWLSLADSDVLLWAKGLALGKGLDVVLKEPDVSPLALQGPKADEVAAAVFGNWVKELKFFRFKELDFEGMPLVIARSGWSKKGGFELYLRDARYAEVLWERLMQAGKSFGIAPGAPSSIERIETGLLSYGSDMTLDNNPFEIGLDNYCDLDQGYEFIGKEALKKIKREGVKQRLIGLELDYDQKLQNEHFWPVYFKDECVGKVTSAVYSVALNKNIALALVAMGAHSVGTQLRIQTNDAEVAATVVTTPFVS